MEQKNNSGALFKNDKKTADNQPDYRGKIVVDNKEWEISLWLRESNKGLKYFSAAIKEPWIAPTDGVQLQSTSDKIKADTNDFDDGLPF
jgi:uncharacterized protein (DUF736 family)